LGAGGAVLSVNNVMGWPVTPLTIGAPFRIEMGE
jgi:hypothetical protein